MEKLLPDHWYIEHSGESLILDPEVVNDEINGLVKAAVSAAGKLQAEIKQLRAELAMFRAQLTNAHDEGVRVGLALAAEEIDCGGPAVCTVQKLDDGSCIRSVSKECPHDEADYIRSLAPPVNRPAEPAGESNA